MCFSLGSMDPRTSAGCVLKRTRTAQTGAGGKDAKGHARVKPASFLIWPAVAPPRALDVMFCSCRVVEERLW